MRQLWSVLMKLGLNLALLGFATSVAWAASPDSSARFLVHLLDYLAKDYGGAVADGKVISKGEYQEQVEFSESALKTNTTLKETKESPEIQGKLAKLNQLILSKADPTRVSRLAREIQNQVMQVSRLEVAPTHWPNLRQGKTLYTQNCVSCHGSTGAGDGPAGVALTPKPANFLDSSMREVSPFQAYNTIRLGVPGTGMASFHTLSDKEVWDLAFYVISLRHSQTKKNQDLEEVLARKPDLLKQVATASDEKLKTLFSDNDEKDGALLLAALRTHSGDDGDGTGGGLLTLARTFLSESLKDYQNTKISLAETKALKAYLEGIEPIESRLRASDSGVVAALEEKMALVRSVISSAKPVAELEAAISAAQEEIDRAQGLLENKKMSPWLAFVAAAAILFREGFEAALIIIALLSVIRASGSRRAALWVHGGWVSAVSFGLVTWFFAGWLMGISGAQRETLEGATSLFAVAVLLVVGFWLHSQTETGRWQAFIHGRVQRALEGKKLFILASISFIAVFREAFETVLFLRAIWFESGETTKAAMTAGVLAAFGFVAILAWSILRYSSKIPIRRLFEASALIMAALAFILTGKGLHALQESGALPVSSSPISIHWDWIGLYPTWETLIAQLLTLGIVFTLWSYGRRPSTPRTSVQQMMPET